MIGTHAVTVYPDPSDNPGGTPVDVTCLVDDLGIVHGRSDTGGQPDAPSCTLNITVGPDTPLPGAVEIGAWVLVETTIPAGTFTRFRGRLTDVNLGWDDAGEDTPDAGVGQLVAVGALADYARRVIGDEPWPQELDGARVARVFQLAGVALDPATSDPGIYALTPRDVDRQPALNVAQGAASSAGGLVWYTRDGEIRYADTEHRRGHDVDLDLDSCDVLVTPTWQRNLAGLVNLVHLTYGVAPEGGSAPTVTASNEGSMTRYGRYEYSATVELADALDAAASAALLVGMGGAPVWMLQAMPLDVFNLDAAQTAVVLGLEVHSLIRVGGLPANGATPTNAVLWVEGWTETLAWGVHELELVVSDYCRTSPPPRWDDVLATYTWDTVPKGMTWDGAACLGPLPNLGRWDDVAATVRWDDVDPALKWDDVGAGLP